MRVLSLPGTCPPADGTAGAHEVLATYTVEKEPTGQKQVKALEAECSQMRRALFDAQDQVDQQREELISSIETKLGQEVTAFALFEMEWALR